MTRVRRLRILFLTYYFFPHVGGATWTSYNLAKELWKKGHNVLLLAPYIVGLRISRKNVGSLNYMFYSVDRYPIPRIVAPLIGCLRTFWMAFSVLRRKRFDCIIVQYHPHHFNFPFALFLARVFQLPLVARSEDIYRNMGAKQGFVWNFIVQLINTVNEKLIRYSDLFLVVGSENMKLLHFRRPEIPTRILQLSPNGFDSTHFVSRQHKKSGRDNKIIVFVGRFSGAEYGLQLLLRAMMDVVKSVPDARLILVGDELNESSKRYINESGLATHIKVHPPVDQNYMARIVAKSSVCIGPLFPTQAIPLKVLEYMASEKPVVAGVKSLSSDLAVNGENCIMVHSNAHDIAKAIIKILSNTELANRIGKNAKASVKQFSWENVAEDILNKLCYVTNAHYNKLSRT